MLLMRRLAVIVLCLLLGTLVVPQVRADAVTKHRLTYDDVEIEVLAEGNGPAVVILPSLGRSARDYDEVSRFLAEGGFRVLRPQPRGIEGSTGPLTHITLHDFAKDIAKVIEENNSGPAIVVGHAYGNVVARTLATDRPDLVRGVVLAAAVAGRLPKGEQGTTISPKIREAIDKSHDLGLPDSERLEYMRIAFFAPGHDPSVWLGGWYPHVIDAQWAARNATPTETFFSAGTAPILDLQAEYDTVAPRRYAHILKEALGDRVTVHVVKDAGHALAPEQPKAMSDAIATFARSLR